MRFHFLLFLSLPLLLGGPLSAEPWQRYQLYDATRLCNGLDEADVDKDGLDDYLTNFEDTGRVVLIRHPGLDKIRERWSDVEVGNFSRVESTGFGDVDGDGWVDVVVAHGREEGEERAGITIIWNPGDSSKCLSGDNWKNSEYIPESLDLGNYLYVRTADLNADGALDIVAGGRAAHHAAEQANPGDPVVGLVWFEAPLDRTDRRDVTKWKAHDIDSDIISGHGFKMGDLDGDGDLDLALANADWGTPEDGKYMLWYENPGSQGLIQQPWKRQILYENKDFFTKPGIALADMDGDQRKDILSQLNDKILLFRNLGLAGESTQFEKIEIAKPSYAIWRSRPVEAADLNADGWMDIVIGLVHRDGLLPKEIASMMVFFSQGQPGQLTDWDPQVIKWGDGFDGKDMWTGEKWDNITFTDLDQDGDLDIVANCEEYEPLGVEWFENPGIR